MSIQLIVDNQVKIAVRSLSVDQLKAIRKVCTVRNPEYFTELEFNGWVRPTIPQYYTVYEEVGGHIVIPRGAIDKAVDILGDAEIIYKTSSYESIGLQIKTHMQDREYQNKAVDTMLEYNDGILVAPTGSGKTNIMIKLIQKVDQPTMIMVHRSHLLNQWRERIKKFLGYEPGIIGEGKWKVKNITIAMIPTLHVHNRRMKELRKRFGLIIIDECHHIPAFTWISNVVELGADRIYGCSATPKRKDGLQQLMYLTIGPIRHILQDYIAVNSGAIMPVQVNVIRTPFEGFYVRNKRDFSRMIPSVVIDNDRNKLIVNQIAKEAGHSQLVLSDRINHLKLLKQLIDKKPGITAELVIGETSVKKREEIFQKVASKEVNVILASSVADEGLDIPILDRLHLTFPTANPDRNMQQIGRIRRPAEGKSDAVVYDYFDWKNPTLSKQFQRRKSKYRQNNFKLEFIGALHDRD